MKPLVGVRQVLGQVLHTCELISCPQQSEEVETSTIIPILKMERLRPRQGEPLGKTAQHEGGSWNLNPGRVIILPLADIY